ncbi:MAG: orotate phosphoribosyltransferase [Halobacteriovoraceae bacterium]|nr:orotate phosphoribosyltransferase [Halobacteriovoraceae bacterium]|tara:strand:+ start:11045 stop:11665 length:621 start_codon:yes stop_codon:yes gene_type:complete
MSNINKVAHALLESRSVFIQPDPEKYFTWTSGVKSPIYCDNRQLISYPTYRQEIIKKFSHHIQNHYPQIEAIAGTATAGIPWAAWIAHELDLPMLYIRSKPKDHGTNSTIEGKVTHKQNILIIEDLISTGKSSINAYQNAIDEGLSVEAVLSIFTYDFKIANEKFKEQKIDLFCLCTLDDLLDYAGETKLLNESEISTVRAWKDNF